MTSGGEKGQQTDPGNGTGGGQRDTSTFVRAQLQCPCLVALQQRVSDHEQGKASIPQYTEPGAGLRAATEQTIARKQTRKGRHVGQRH